MRWVMSSLAIGFMLGILVGWGKGYDKGEEDCWRGQEMELINNHATAYERWLVGHDESS